MNIHHQRLLSPSFILCILLGGCGVEEQLEFTEGKAEKATFAREKPEMALDLVNREQCREIRFRPQWESKELRGYWASEGEFFWEDLSEPMEAQAMDEGKLAYVMPPFRDGEILKNFSLVLENSSHLFQLNEDQTGYNPYMVDKRMFCKQNSLTPLGMFFWIYDAHVSGFSAGLFSSYQPLTAAIFWMPPQELRQTPEKVSCQRVTNVEEIQADGCYWLDATVEADQAYPFCF